MLERLMQWDNALFLRLNGSDSAFWDNFMWIVTKTYTWIPLLLVLLVVILKNSDFRRFLLTFVGLVLVVLIADRLSSGLIKPLVCRLRPTHDPAFLQTVDTVFGYRGGQYGFVSSHAANTFGVFAFLSLVLRSRMMTFGLFLWACLSSYSRIYLGVHYPGDILCGALLGMTTGLLVYLLFAYVNYRAGMERQYYSTAYTSSGFLISDMNLLMFSLFLTYCCIFLVALTMS